jgi:hypothetical protein
VSKGERNEQQLSLYYHSQFIPLLISAKILREAGAGQVDIAVMQNTKRWKAILIEVKSRSNPSQKQWQRLKKSQDYLSRVLDCETILEVKFCQKDFDSLS